MLIIHASGSHKQVGRQHGERKKQEIQRTCAEEVTRICRTLGKNEEELLGSLVVFLPFFRNLAPLLLEEIEGIAEGAGISFEHGLLLNVRHDLRPPIDPGCTTFAAGGEITRSGKPIAGHNKDGNPVTAAGLFLLGIHLDKGPGLLGFTYPGEIGLRGISDRGASVFGNSLYVRNASMGVPHNLARRMLLEIGCIGDCEAALKEAAGFSPANLTIVDTGGETACFELVKDRFRVIRAGGGLVTHTNHVLHHDLVGEEMFPEKQTQSVLRLQRLEDLLSTGAGDLTVSDVMNALRDHTHAPQSICRHGGELRGMKSHTVVSSVADVAEGVLHVAKGPPCREPYVAYSL